MKANEIGSGLVTNEATETVCATSEVAPSVGHHPLGRTPSRNLAKNIKRGTGSSLSRRASSGVDHNPQKSYKLLSKSQETEAAEVCSTDIHNNESWRGYDKRPPSLTDSEYESDPDSEFDVTEGANLNHLPDTAPRVTDYMKTSNIGSEKVNSGNNHELAIPLINIKLKSRKLHPESKSRHPHV